jgi:hypothetical protein
MGWLLGRTRKAAGAPTTPPAPKPESPSVTRAPAFEFLIRRVDGDWFTIDATQMPQVLRPLAAQSTKIEGWGDNRICVPQGIISFSYEDPGIQVIFEEFKGTDVEAERLADDIRANIEKETGEKGRVVRTA